MSSSRTERPPSLAGGGSGAGRATEIGPSGSGKSSLVQAGLLPVIEAGSSRLGRTFVARTMRPGERSTERLAKVLDGDLATPVQAVEACVARHPPAERALVFIDQLEELFTVAAADERQRFIEALETLRASTRCCFVLALRADFFGALMDSALWVRASLSRLEVAPLQGKALAEAIAAQRQRLTQAGQPDAPVADAQPPPASSAQAPTPHQPPVMKPAPQPAPTGNAYVDTFQAPPSKQAMELWGKAGTQATTQATADQAKFDAALPPMPVQLDGGEPKGGSATTKASTIGCSPRSRRRATRTPIPLQRSRAANASAAS